MNKKTKHTNLKLTPNEKINFEPVFQPDFNYGKSDQNVASFPCERMCEKECVKTPAGPCERMCEPPCS